MPGRIFQDAALAFERKRRKRRRRGGDDHGRRRYACFVGSLAQAQSTLLEKSDRRFFFVFLFVFGRHFAMATTRMTQKWCRWSAKILLCSKGPFHGSPGGSSPVPTYCALGSPHRMSSRGRQCPHTVRKNFGLPMAQQQRGFDGLGLRLSGCTVLQFISPPCCVGQSYSIL